MGRINLQRQQSWLITAKSQCCPEKRWRPWPLTLTSFMHDLEGLHRSPQGGPCPLERTNRPSYMTHSVSDCWRHRAPETFKYSARESLLPKGEAWQANAGPCEYRDSLREDTDPPDFLSFQCLGPFRHGPPLPTESWPFSD